MIKLDWPLEIRCERKGGFRLGIGIYKSKLSCGFTSNPRYSVWLVFSIDIIIYTIKISKQIKSAWNNKE